MEPTIAETPRMAVARRSLDAALGRFGGATKAFNRAYVQLTAAEEAVAEARRELEEAGNAR